MVRVNLIRPSHLADQHLIAEYAEILAIFRYAKKHPDTKNIPKKYCLGTGHIRFFKNKLAYLKKRHEALKKEMRRRGFRPRFSVSFAGVKKHLIRGYKPTPTDKQVIKRRLIWKLKKKKGFYRYRGTTKPTAFFLRLTKTA